MKMGSIRDQAKFDRAQWQLMVLVPCWMVQISLYMILIGTCSYLLVNSVKDSDEERQTAVVWECITIAVSAISIVCTAYEIFKTFSEALTPKEVMVSNLVKLVGTVLSMIIDGIMAGTDLWKWSIGTQVANGLAVAAVIILGSYAAWKWRLLAQYDDYHHPANVKPFGFKSDLKGRSLHSRHPSDEDWDVELSLANMGGGMASPEQATGTTKTKTKTTTTTSTRDRGTSFVKVGGRLGYSATRDMDEVNEQGGGNGSHSRNSSASALMSVDTSYESQTNFTNTNTNTNTNTDTDTDTTTTTGPTEAAGPARGSSPAPYISVTGTGTGRRASYNHTRDTSFDQYVQQRRSSQQQQQQQQQQHRSQGSGSSSGSAGSRHSLGLIPLGPSSPPPPPNPAAAAAAARSRARSNTDREAAPQAQAQQQRGPGGRESQGQDQQKQQQQQQQQKDLKDDVDDALGAEFGWGAAHRRTSSQDSAVAGGAVAGARSVRDSLGRAPSDGSESGVVLGPLPEGRGVEDGDGDGDGDGGDGGDRFEAAGVEGDLRGRGDLDDEASRALLGGEEEGARVYPAALRKLDGYGRARGMSETIEFVVTPPPRGSTEERRDARKTWGAAYHRP